MIPHRQLNERDCFRAAVASVMECHPRDVPDFVSIGGEKWQAHLDYWLRGRGVISLMVEGVVKIANGVYCVGSFFSRREVPHAVVMCGEEIVWDPSGRTEVLGMPDAVLLFIVKDPSTMRPLPVHSDSPSVDMS